MGSRARCRRQQGEERGVRDRLFQQRAEPMLGGRGVVLCPQPRQLGFGSSGRDPLARSAPSRPGARHHDRPQHIGVGARVTSPWICLLELDPDERTPIDSECMRGAAGSRPKFCKRFATQTGRGYGPGMHRAGWATELRRVTSRTARRTPGVWGVSENPVGRASTRGTHKPEGLVGVPEDVNQQGRRRSSGREAQAPAMWHTACRHRRAI